MTGNPDLAVLRPENQNPTHVTPLVDTLALGLFREHLQVIGAAPKRLTPHEVAQRQKKVREHIGELLVRSLEGDSTVVEFPSAGRLVGKYWKLVEIRGENLKVACFAVLVFRVPC